MDSYKKIIISRTDSIGDVVLTLPIAGYLKSIFPNVKIIFIGRSYTQPIVDYSKNIDRFVNWDIHSKYSKKTQVAFLSGLGADAIIHVFPNKQIALMAKKAGIKIRIGTSHRSFHWFTCNKMVNFSRKNSNLHEAQLNFKLLAPLGLNNIPETSFLPAFYGYRNKPINDKSILQFIDKTRANIILHPKSKGSAREWGLQNFDDLIKILPSNKYNVIVAGTETDGTQMNEFIEKNKNRIINATGKLNLKQYISLISNCQALIAASTGPLHIAAALGIKAIGLYAPMRPIDAGRWGPIGTNAKALFLNKKCNKCQQLTHCECIESITPQMVKDAIEKTS